MSRVLAACLAMSPLTALAADERPSREISLIHLVQFNQRFTEHSGFSLQFSWHLNEILALTANGNFFYRGVKSDFSHDLIEKAHLQPETATSVTQHWGADAGAQFAPFYGDFKLLGEDSFVQMFIHGGVGLASTRVEIRDTGDDIAAVPGFDIFRGNVSNGRSFGDTGLHLYGAVGAGLRIFFGGSWSVRFEVRDLVMPVEVTTINGCTQQDIVQMSSGGTVTNTGCRTGSPNPWVDKRVDGELAFDLLKPPDDRSAPFTSDVLHQMLFYAGVSFLL